MLDKNEEENNYGEEEDYQKLPNRQHLTEEVNLVTED
jgi:hypothetical protein